MIRTTLGAATVGLAVLALAAPASAQVGRFDPGLSTSSAPQLTNVQFNPQGGQLRRPGGAGPRMGHGGGGGPRFGGGGQGPRFGGGGQRFGGGDYRRRGGGFGVGAGVAGLAAGALIGGAIASQAAPAYGYGYGPGYGYDGGYQGGTVYAAPPVPDDEDADAGVAAVPAGGDPSAYCAQRFKSYDPSSGTYLGFDGERHPCP